MTTFEKRLISQFMKLIRKADMDKMISGNSFWEFTDRKMEIIDPCKIMTKYNKKGIIIRLRRLTKLKYNKKGIIICPRKLTKYHNQKIKYKGEQNGKYKGNN